METPWTFWFDKKLPRAADYKQYEANLKRLGTVHSLEELWR